MEDIFRNSTVKPTEQLNNMADSIESIATCLSALNRVFSHAYLHPANRVADIDEYTDVLIDKIGILEMRVRNLRASIGLPMIRE